jgi:hypothetical protein
LAGTSGAAGLDITKSSFLFESNSHCTRLFDVLTDDTGA